MKRLPIVVLLLAVACLAQPTLATAAPKGHDSPKRGGKPKDTSYKQPVFFTWERGALDVLIVPPNHGQLVNGNGVLNNYDPDELDPCQNSYVTAMKQAIEDWRKAVDQFGSNALKNTLSTEDYVVGCDDEIPAEALLDPEIVIVTDETKAVILGLTLSTRAGEPRIEGVPCLVDNSKFFVTSFTDIDMYNVGGHEYGHCLGLDHAEGGPKRDTTLQDDMMFATYGQSPGSRTNHRQCQSNLNVRGLERVFGALFVPEAPSGGTATLAPAEYQKISC